MAETNAKSGYGLLFERGATATATGFAATGEVVSLKGGGIEVAELPAGHTQSPDAVEESIPGMIKIGDITLEINYAVDDSSQDLLIADAELGPAQPRRYFRITWPPKDDPAAIWVFRGWVKKFEPSNPHDGKVTATVVIRPTTLYERT